MAGRTCGTPSTSLAALSDEVVQLYVLPKLSLEDLCAFGCVSRRCKQLVLSADEAWAALHHALFGDNAGPAKPPELSWREDVKHHWLKGRKERAQRRLARQLRLLSLGKVLEQEAEATQQKLHSAREQRGLLLAELSSLQQARQAGAALLCWEPAVVRKAHESVVSQKPVEGEWRLRDVREAVRDNQVHVEALSRSLRASKERLRGVCAELAAHRLRCGALHDGPVGVPGGVVSRGSAPRRRGDGAGRPKQSANEANR